MSGKLRLSGSSSGYIELQSEAAANSSTLTVPNGGFGKILQVVQTVKTDTFTTTADGTSWTEITGLNVTITPSSTSNKLLIDATISCSPNGENYSMFFSLYDGSTQLTDFLGDTGESNQTRCMSAERHDANGPGTSRLYALISPSTTSAKTYKIYCLNENNGTININRMGQNSNLQQYGLTISTMTAMELSA